MEGAYVPSNEITAPEIVTGLIRGHAPPRLGRASMHKRKPPHGFLHAAVLSGVIGPP
jgi:hypothetical protein